MTLYALKDVKLRICNLFSRRIIQAFNAHMVVKKLLIIITKSNRTFILQVKPLIELIILIFSKY